MLFFKKSATYSVYYRYKTERERKVYGDGWLLQFEGQTKQEAKEAAEGFKHDFQTFDGRCMVDVKVEQER